MLGVLRTICTVVGALVLYCALTAAMWALVTRAAKRRVRLAAERRAAAAALAVAEPRRPRDPRDRRQDVVKHLDDDEVERIRVAMQIRRGRLEPDEGLTRLS